MEKVKAEFEKHSKEALKIELIDDCFYVFGTELACLRLAYAYRRSGDKARAQYSENLKTWFFCLDR